jgi:proteasome accessory factor B
LLTLARLLCAGSAPTVHTLAARFRVRRESIYRDLKALQEIGFPVVGDAQGRLSRPRLAPEGRPAPPLAPLTSRETAALTWAVAQAQATQPFRAALTTALAKLQGSVSGPGETGFQVGAVSGVRVRGVTAMDPEQLGDRLLGLAEAILTRRRCQVVYRSPERPRETRFPFDPYHLTTVQGGIYCLGKAPAYGEVITLALERIQALAVTAEPFPGDPAFDPAARAAEAFGVIWERPQRIVLRFRADQAPYVRERVWHPSQTVRALQDGRLELTFRAGGTFEITRWLLSWGSAVEVVAPRRLRDRLRAEHAAAARLGADPGGR